MCSLVSVHWYSRSLWMVKWITLFNSIPRAQQCSPLHWYLFTPSKGLKWSLYQVTEYFFHSPFVSSIKLLSREVIMTVHCLKWSRESSDRWTSDSFKYTALNQLPLALSFYCLQNTHLKMKFTIVTLSLCVLIAVSSAFSHSRSQDVTTSSSELEVVTPKKIGYGGIGALRSSRVETVGKAFCALYRFANDRGNGPSKIKSFIEKKFPQKWHNYLFGKLVYRGVLAVVDIAAELCNVQEPHAERYLEKALLIEPAYTIPADGCLFAWWTQ